MLICNNCGEVFDEPKTIEEHHPYGMSYATEYWSACPYCESTDIDEAEECSCCGEWVTELHDGLCDICYSDMND